MFYLDLNHDGINDFRFSTTHRSGTGAAHAGTFFRTSAAQLRVYPVGTRNQIWGHSSYASALKPGVRVGPKFPQGGFSMVEVRGINSQLSVYYGPWEGTKSNRTVKNLFAAIASGTCREVSIYAPSGHLSLSVHFGEWRSFT